MARVRGVAAPPHHASDGIGVTDRNLVDPGDAISGIAAFDGLPSKWRWPPRARLPTDRADSKRVSAAMPYARAPARQPNGRKGEVNRMGQVSDGDGDTDLLMRLQREMG
jgi:hypothetical protein